MAFPLSSGRIIERATHRAGAAAQDVGIDHSCLHISVTKQLLHGADIVASLKEMGGETMAKGVAGNEGRAKHKVDDSGVC